MSYDVLRHVGGARPRRRPAVALRFDRRRQAGERVPRVPHRRLLATTTTLPGGERVSSLDFLVGGCRWRVDLYPNGADRSRDASGSVSLYLNLVGGGWGNRRVRAQYRFSLLDPAGHAAYERPAETGVFTRAGDDSSSDDDDDKKPRGRGCGHAEFISAEELEGRRESLLAGDCLAVRCDVDVTELMRAEPLGENQYYSFDDSSDSSDSDSDSDMPQPGKRRRRRHRRRRRREVDDAEYIRRCLAQRQRYR
ncbi:hypothetical protein ACP70R_003032 [Stipagrostis hirtigluma subsp. patula]